MTTPGETLGRTTLDQLQSEEQTKLLNVIDRLRSQGVGRLLGEDGLPQLIVCGDQSSGKSSVLEALTRVRFPTKSGLCTTFATELILRRTTNTRITAKIKPGPSRKGEDKTHLEQFRESFSSPDQLPALVESARECMKINTNASANAMFDDVLQVEINGPDLAPLTIVDLPGIIQFQNNQQPDKDVAFVEKLVTSYMEQKNSIILAIVSAPNDPSNQAVLRHAQKIVPDGKRTLGIITKPDTLEHDSEMEQTYLELPRNEQIRFEYGWHVVRNRSFATRDITNDERDAQEKQFFEESVWAALPNSGTVLGIDALRKKLSTILLNHIRLQLPLIKKRLEKDIEETKSQLDRLGYARSTTKDQQQYLREISERYKRLAGAALRGDYHIDNAFFGVSLSSEDAKKRLRATIRNLNEDFADAMFKKGHKWEIKDDDTESSSAGDIPRLAAPDSSNPTSEEPQVISKSKFLREVVSELARLNRGQELDGTPNPLLVGHLFRKQSEPWERIAQAHLNAVYHTIREFLDLTFGHLTPDERTCDKLLKRLIDPIMGSRNDHATEKLRELLTPYKFYEPISIDPRFASKMQSAANARVSAKAVENLRKAYGDLKENPFARKTTRELTLHAGSARSEDDLLDDKYGCSTSLDRLAVEQCLVAGLDEIFPPSGIDAIDNETLEAVAGESSDNKAERVRLEKKLGELKAGQKTIVEESPRETLRAGNLAVSASRPRSASPADNQGPSDSRTLTLEPVSSSPPSRSSSPSAAGAANTPASASPGSSAVTVNANNKSAPSAPASTTNVASQQPNPSGLQVTNTRSSTAEPSTSPRPSASPSPAGNSTASPSQRPASTDLVKGSGNNNSNNTSGSTGLSGSSAGTPKPSTSNLFGSPGPAPQANALPTFGSISSATPKPSTSSPFGSSTPAPTATVGGFGQLPPTSKPATGGVFGSPTPTPETGTGGLFGASSATPKPGTAGLFGSTTSAANTSGFGAAFGPAPPAPKPGTGSLFGSAPPTSKPPASNFFGKPATASGTGGSGFGLLGTTASPSGGLFGGSNLFGTQANASPSGAQANASPFGAPAFGSSKTTRTGFGGLGSTTSSPGKPGTDGT
ncbi:hypothetical protein AOQ84DRAFT_358850 [Glonium stellatum]|uniref:Dynamin-type G domain-containing protein n=1 Tax=Glonium stellatum TaxID=574774 RepID=A0A8E2FC81_9PEZI|nr:hypothetical protein AOQ84DRAFT_358850 [Glonium stellatum]